MTEADTVTADPTPAETQPKRISSWALVAAGGLLAALLIVAIGMAFLVGRALSAADSIVPDTPIERVGPIAIETIHGLADLTTVEAVAYTTVEKGTDRGWLDWAAGDSISMFAVARIGAGVDLTRIDAADVQADTQAASIRVVIPPAEVQFVDVDEEATHVYNRDTGLFTRGDPNLERAARLAAEEILVEQVIADGLLDDAEASAVTVLTDFLGALGYTDVEVVVADR